MISTSRKHTNLTKRNRRVLLVIAYKEPTYVRFQSLCSAFSRISGVELLILRNKSPGAYRYIEVLRKLHSQVKLWKPDLVVIGFRGYEIYWPVRWIVGPDIPIILDAMMSPYGALWEEYKFGMPGRLAAIPWYPIERSTLRDAAFILTDTPAHQKYLADLHEIRENKIESIPVGADENVLAGGAPELAPNTTFTVLFYGSFLPLHGVDVILQAVSRLSGQPIRFEFIGCGRRDAKRIAAACEQAGIEYSHRKWIEYEILVSEIIPRADLCLGGPFGKTPQARRVVTGKTSQSLALGKATVVGVPVPVPGFVDKKNCLLVPHGDHDALAKQIRWASDHREELSAIGAEGKHLYQQRLSIDVILHRLKNVLEKVLS